MLDEAGGTKRMLDVGKKQANVLNCKICSNAEGNQTHTAREMMLGLREEFDYLECSRCGCVQLINVPGDLSKYYPENYYSFSDTVIEGFGFLRTFLRRQKHSYGLGRKNPIGAILTKRAGTPPHLDWLRTAGLGFNSSILDVGSGAGKFLYELRRDGFNNLRGVDPFIEQDIKEGNSLVIWKKGLSDVDQQFDFVIMNHSFEHMPEPLDVIRNVRRVLKPNRYALIRIPIASSYAWRKYGVNWVQLDAPRHLFLHTVESMNILAKEAGLKITEMFYDSSTFQFTGSEKYLRGIPLVEDTDAPLFSQDELAEFQAMTDKLNREGQGDQAGFYLKRE